METKKWTNEIYDIAIKDRGTSDYLYLLSKGVTEETRKKFGCGDLFINGAVCKKCGDFIRSKNVHDFKFCSCKSVAVDGGSRYGRRVGHPEDYINVIEYFNKD